MSLEIFFKNQKDQKFVEKPLRDSIIKAFHLIERDNSLKGNINLIFVNEKDIKEINHNFRGVNEVTDVISFELDEQTDVLGEIYICISYVKEKLDANLANLLDEQTLSNELLRLFIHGMLHIIGYNHTGHIEFGKELENDEEMFIKQEEILTKILSGKKNSN